MTGRVCLTGLCKHWVAVARIEQDQASARPSAMPQPLYVIGANEPHHHFGKRLLCGVDGSSKPSKRQRGSLSKPTAQAFIFLRLIICNQVVFKSPVK